MQPSWITAKNPGPFTLSGTRTFFVGDRRIAVIDPGPAGDAEHVEALAARIEAAAEATVVLTHGHSDHSGALEDLLDRVDVRVVGTGHDLAEPLRDGAEVSTDAGVLIAVSTPGHAEFHLAFHWPAAAAAFLGDLVLGEGNTTWVGEYPGCVADYLVSLQRVRALECRTFYPAHGDPIEDTEDCLERYRAHRMDRIAQVRTALEEEPDADLDRIFQRVYGDIVLEGLHRKAAEMSLEALLDFVRRHPA